jgi:acyl-coenzyme A thioesterase PaaI-like protein
MKQKLSMSRMSLLKYMNLWPPLLGAGIKVVKMDKHLRAIDVEMRMRAWNRNIVGSHFGGSLFAMTDPFYMLMLIENLGRQYVVWDKAASIRYRKPGKGTMRAEFRLSVERVEEIRAVIETGERCEPRFVIEVKDEAGDVVAEVERVVYCAKRDVHEARANARVTYKAESKGPKIIGKNQKAS